MTTTMDPLAGDPAANLDGTQEQFVSATCPPSVLNELDQIMRRFPHSYRTRGQLAIAAVRIGLPILREVLNRADALGAEVTKRTHEEAVESLAKRGPKVGRRKS